MSQIDIRLLQAALAVADCLSFSRAAAQLGITQPGLTKQIQDLETALGVVLFERNNQRVEITEPGRVFIEHARLSVFHLDRAVHLTRAAAKGAEAVINFGSSPYSDPYLTSTVLSVRLPLFPTLRIHAHSNFSEELARQVATGELDIAMVAAGVPNSRLNFTRVSDQPFFAVFNERNHLVNRRTVSLRDFQDRVWIIFERHVHPCLYDRFFVHSESLGVRAQEIHHVTTAEEASQLVTQCDGVAFITRMGAWRIAHHGLTMRPLANSELRVKTTLVTRSDDKSRLMSEYLRTAMKRLKPVGAVRQQSLPLTS